MTVCLNENVSNNRFSALKVEHLFFLCTIKSNSLIKSLQRQPVIYTSPNLIAFQTQIFEQSVITACVSLKKTGFYFWVRSLEKVINLIVIKWYIIIDVVFVCLFN